MKIISFILTCAFTFSAFGLSAIDQAVLDAGIQHGDSLENKIDKTLWLLNEKHYLRPPQPIEHLRPPFDIPYQLDSMRTPEQILEQKIGGFCGSAALAFAAILNASGVDSKDMQIVTGVVNDDLAIICPSAGAPRVQDPHTGAPGHVFVAVRFANGKWVLINTTDPSQTYQRAEWISPEEVQRRMKHEALVVPPVAFADFPADIYGSGMTVFQSWPLSEVPMHTFEQRYDLIASGNLKQAPSICRFTAAAKKTIK